MPLCLVVEPLFDHARRDPLPAILERFGADGVTIVILKIMDVVWPGGIRVTPKEEEIGLDLAQHGERAYVNE